MINEALIGRNTSLYRIRVNNITELKNIIKEEYEKNPQELNLNRYDISDLNSLAYIFASCDKLETIHIEDWNTVNIMTMDSMFFDCISLKSINIRNWDVQKLGSTESMFLGCKSLESVDISNWKPYKLRDMGKMFFKCPKLKELLLPQLYLFPERRDTSNMFKGCFTLSRNKSIPDL